MKTPAAQLPDLPTLRQGLTAALLDPGAPSRPVRILARRLPPFMSTFPNEIVTCRLPNGRKKRVFVKYARGQSHTSFGHRGDVAYEAQVYERLLQTLPDFRPQCLGAYHDSRTGEAWLILQYIYGSVRVSDLSYKRALRQPRAMREAAGWLGRFHATHQTRVLDPSLSFLKRYDAEYYRGWSHRTFAFARHFLGRFPWLVKFQASGDRWFAPLLESPTTVIHGEFYSKTVLLRNERLFMLDWESAAVAPGEIDLAALTEGIHWPRKLVQMCERAYIRARWPKGAPSSFQRTLNAAKIYLHFRWLGERLDWATRERSLWRYQDLYSIAKISGFI